MAGAPADVRFDHGPEFVAYAVADWCRFDTLREARILLEDWRIGYNMNRPHPAHDGLSPTEFVQAWLNQRQLQHA